MNTQNNGCRLESFQAIGNESKRLVDPKRFIDFLRESKVKETGAFSKGINKGLNIAISALGNDQIVPTVDATDILRGMWIPVSERLPEHCITVLSYDGRHYRTIKTDSYDHCFECWLSDMDNILGSNTVTHWMPLPESPKEKNNG